MEQHHPHQQEPGFFERNKTIIKGFLIGALILIMLIPAVFVHELVSERAQRQQQVISEISSKWAGLQTITGPVLVIPYKLYFKDATGKTMETRKNAYLLPEHLKVDGRLSPEVKHRSLYDVTLYRSQTTLSGSFSTTPLENLRIPAEHILWNDCHLMVGIDDARGLEEELRLQWGSDTYTLEAGLPDNSLFEHGLSTPIGLDTGKMQPFSLNLKIKGSELFYFTPVGKTTEVRLSAPWKDPAFDGQYLPVNSIISKDGFTANWKVLQVSRNYPQFWTDGKYDLKASAFGVRLIQPTDSYAKTERSVKYAILFIALTFTIFFFLEVLQKQQIHPLQYILVGMALCIFYTLLLSISEYAGFNTAYVVSALATVTLIGLYVWSMFRKGRIAMGFALALGGLYTYIFILIQLQDYALLFGSIGLFLIVAVLMYFSRKIDWYNAGRVSSQNV